MELSIQARCFEKRGWFNIFKGKLKYVIDKEGLGWSQRKKKKLYHSDAKEGKWWFWNCVETQLFEKVARA